MILREIEPGTYGQYLEDCAYLRMQPKGWEDLLEGEMEVVHILRENAEEEPSIVLMVRIAG